MKILTSWADLSLDVFWETFRRGGARIESENGRFRVAEGSIPEFLRGVVGGVWNVSSEEESCSISAGSSVLRANTASEGIISDVRTGLVFAKSSAISSSG